MIKRLCLVLSVTLWLIACASKPLHPEQEPLSLTPARAAENRVSDGTVLWGGVILNSVNLSDSTQIEVLAYPLDRIQRPRREAATTGRFLIRTEGYLETSDYAEGRLLTVLGTLSVPLDGKIGEADYRYPVVIADQLHLWHGAGDHQAPRFTFGIGVQLSN